MSPDDLDKLIAEFSAENTSGEFPSDDLIRQINTSGDLNAQAKLHRVIFPAKKAENPIANLVGIFNAVAELNQAGVFSPVKNTPVENTPVENTPVEIKAPVIRKAVITAEEKSRCEMSLAEFVKHSWHVLEPATELEWDWPHDVLSVSVQALIEDINQAKRTKNRLRKDLVINVPPGMLKSRIISVCAPVWAWLRYPNFRMLSVSRNPRVSSRDNSYAKDLINSKWFRETFAPKWNLKKEDATLTANTANGSRTAIGMGATLTGERFDLIILDDPDDLLGVYNVSEQQQTERSWRATANRINDDRASGRVVVQQRCHSSGDWTAQFFDPEYWDRIQIPLEYDLEIAKQDKITGPRGWKDPRSVPGDVLMPYKFTPKIVAKLRKEHGMHYAAWYGQRPNDVAGGIFKAAHWRFFRESALGLETNRRPEGCTTAPSVVMPAPEKIQKTVLSIDAAFKGKTTGSRVALTVISFAGEDVFVRHASAAHRDFAETLTAMIEILSAYKISEIWIEDKANGPAIVSEMRAMQGTTRLRERGITWLPKIVELNPNGGKEARAAAIQPRHEAGNFYLLDGAGWLSDWVDEFRRFPHADHDDQVDTLSQAVTHHRGASTPAATFAKLGTGSPVRQPERVRKLLK